jgi:hypothetical protein
MMAPYAGDVSVVLTVTSSSQSKPKDDHHAKWWALPAAEMLW